MAWAGPKLGNLVAAWDDADRAQRGQLLGEIFERLLVARIKGEILLTCVPRGPWMPFFRVRRMGKTEAVAAAVMAELYAGGVPRAQGTSRGQVRTGGEPSARRASSD
jgi:hypothetical protein